MRAWGLALIGLLAVGCGEENSNEAAGGGGAGGGSATECSAEERADCAVNQKACSRAEGQATCVACPAGQYANESGACASLEGQKLTHTFPDFTTQPGEEVLGLCRSWTLNNETELWVNAVELSQNEVSHHSNWTFSPEDAFPGEDGVWPCKDRDYDQLSAALAGGVIYAQSTQATQEVQKFPAGAAVRIPPHARIISDIHILNATSSPVTGHMQFSLYSVPPEQVQVKLAPFHVTYDKLAIPPRSKSRFHGTCELASQYEKQTKAPLSMKVYFVLPHTHAQGRRFFLEVVGGPNDGQSIIDVRGFNGEARGRRYTPPLDLAGATGLRFGCEFDNPRESVIHWGFGDQEMCEALGFIESPLAFESRISEANEDGDDGEIHKFTGSCSTAAFPWGK